MQNTLKGTKEGSEKIIHIKLNKSAFSDEIGRGNLKAKAHGMKKLSLELDGGQCRSFDMELWSQRESFFTPVFFRGSLLPHKKTLVLKTFFIQAFEILR